LKSVKRFLTIMSLALALVPVAAFSGEAEEQAVKAAE
jgi:hypothetical protein